MKLKDEMRYLKKVANYFRKYGYRVERPDPNHTDLLDIWGKHNGRKCFIEIYVTIHQFEDGTIIGYWHQGESETVELYLNRYDEIHTYDCISHLLDGLKPMREKKGA